MIVENNTKSNRVPVRSIQCGGAFIYQAETYIKTNRESTIKGTCSIVCLEDGRQFDLENNCMVLRVNARVIIE